MKTETILKHYLPYGLELVFTKNNLRKMVGLVNNVIYYEYEGEVIYCKSGRFDEKPLLKPLSDLAEGSYGEELKDLLIERGVYKNSYAKGHENYSYKILTKPFGKVFKIANHDEWVLMLSFNEPDRTKHFVYEYLLKNHFDVFGLIEKGQAINKNIYKNG